MPPPPLFPPPPELPFSGVKNLPVPQPFKSNKPDKAADLRQQCQENDDCNCQQPFELCRQRRRLHAILAPSPVIRSMNPGKLVAIIDASSTVTGCSEASPRTRKLMAIR